jgi:hypothetical protein
MGLPANSGDMTFIMGGRIVPGSNFITREAPGIGRNTGGGIEVVVPPNSVQIDWFVMP